MTAIRTLIVDDEAAVRRLHERMLAGVRGFEVAATAASGTEALELAASVDLDLVLLDVHLPDFSGVEVLRRLRLMLGTAVDVIVISSASDRLSVAQLATASISDYLVKPFSRANFEARLSNYRDSRTRASRAAKTAAQTPLLRQEDIDGLLAKRASAASAQEHTAMPKGLSDQTARLVLAQLTDEGRSALEIADLTGLSRVSARRYLDHLCTRAQAVAEPQYGKRGRPELRYRRST